MKPGVFSAGGFERISGEASAWRVVSGMLFAVVCLLGIANLLQLNRPAAEPYIVEVDALGGYRVVGKPERTSPEDERIVRYTLQSILLSLRTLSSDRPYMLQEIFRGFSFLEGEAASYVDNAMRHPEFDPRLVARDYSRLVQVESILRLVETSGVEGVYQVHWVEVDAPRSARGRPRTRAFRANMTVSLREPSTPEEVLSNPFGIRITKLEWAEVARGGES